MTQWLDESYRLRLFQQLQEVTSDKYMITDNLLQNYQSSGQQAQQSQQALIQDRQKLLGAKQPNWSFIDSLFFTVVSLFANNYSDICPNTTLARSLIMTEFILVWFLTICAVGLEPDTLWFMPKPSKANQLPTTPPRSSRSA